MTDFKAKLDRIRFTLPAGSYSTSSDL